MPVASSLRSVGFAELANDDSSHQPGVPKEHVFKALARGK
jgi:hypothetical protein